MLLLLTAAGPHYTPTGDLIPPTDYREWVFMGSGLDMSYSATPTQTGMSMFDNVFAEPSAWQQFKRTGYWPDQTMLAMEVRGAASQGSINLHGHYQTDVMGAEIHVRDAARFKGAGARKAGRLHGELLRLPSEKRRCGHNLRAILPGGESHRHIPGHLSRANIQSGFSFATALTMRVTFSQTQQMQPWVSVVGRRRLLLARLRPCDPAGRKAQRPFGVTMRGFSTITGLAALACLLATGAALAGPLNTGVDPNGNPLTPGTVDTSWTGYDSTLGAPVLAYAVSGYGNAWLNQPNAEFISPNQIGGQADNYPSNVNELINWTETFTLTSNGAASNILGAFAVDNQLLSIVITNLNGTFTVTPASGGGFGFLTGFDIPAADLVAGLNTITFDTENYASQSGNPTGLLVEFTQVPEPASIAILGIGLLGLLMLGRRRTHV